MKPADDHIDSRSAEAASEIEGPWKLIRLDSHQADDEPGKGPPAPANDVFHWEFFRRLVKSSDLDVKVPEHAAGFHLLRETVKNVERVTREDAFPKTNDITVVIIFGGLDENNAEVLEGKLRRRLLH
jgi:hypothetical protein